MHTMCKYKYYLHLHLHTIHIHIYSSIFVIFAAALRGVCAMFAQGRLHTGQQLYGSALKNQIK